MGPLIIGIDDVIATVSLILNTVYRTPCLNPQHHIIRIARHIRIIANDNVVTRIAGEFISHASRCIDGIVIFRSANDDVIALVSANDIGAAKVGIGCIDVIVYGCPDHYAVVTDQYIVAGAAVNYSRIANAADDDIVAIAALDADIIAPFAVGDFGFDLQDNERGITLNRAVVAQKDIRIQPTGKEGITKRATDNNIIAGFTVYRFYTIVLEESRIDTVFDRTHRIGTAPHRPVIPEDDIVARAAVNGFVAFSADDHIISGTGVDLAVAAAQLGGRQKGRAALVDPGHDTDNYAVGPADPSVIADDNIITSPAGNRGIAL